MTTGSQRLHDVPALKSFYGDFLKKRVHTESIAKAAVLWHGFGRAERAEMEGTLNFYFRTFCIAIAIMLIFAPVAKRQVEKATVATIELLLLPLVEALK